MALSIGFQCGYTMEMGVYIELVDGLLQELTFDTVRRRAQFLTHVVESGVDIRSLCGEHEVEGR